MIMLFLLVGIYWRLWMISICCSGSYWNLHVGGWESGLLLYTIFYLWDGWCGVNNGEWYQHGCCLYGPYSLGVEDTCHTNIHTVVKVQKPSVLETVQGMTQSWWVHRSQVSQGPVHILRTSGLDYSVCFLEFWDTSDSKILMQTLKTTYIHCVHQEFITSTHFPVS